MRQPQAPGAERTPLYVYGLAAILLLAVVYSGVLVGVVFPQLEPWQRPSWGETAQLLVFTGAAIALFFLRSSDPTAALSVLALVLSGIANAGPPPGVSWPGPLAPIASIAWIAGPVAFPVIALAILYFPAPSGLIERYRALHFAPWIVASPMIALGTARALDAWGVGAVDRLVRWDAHHPEAYYGSFALALALNVLVIVEGIHRYRFNHSANERRRIRMALYTAVPGVLAYAIRNGTPVAAQLLGLEPPTFHPWLSALLHILVLLPAVGLVYAVGVHRVLGPRVVLRRSLQYALAMRSMTAIALLPSIPLITMLVRDRQMTLGAAFATRGLAYAGLIALIIVLFRYRDRARVWLDQRFFREEYDARKILVSLASRVRFETDPADLAALVVRQLDEALHPEMAAFLVDGVDPGWLTPVATLGGGIEPLRSDSGLVAMLRWSDEPLEVFLQDPRSPVARLPPDEQAWLAGTGASLLVPVIGADKALVAVIILGEKRSEEAFTNEDRQLLGSVASQVGLGFDVARMRMRMDSGEADATTRMLSPEARPMMQCPRCGRCEEAATSFCPADGSPLQPVPTVTRVVDNKYRIEHVLGRGGMGAVYRARDMRLDRLVALKVVRAELLGDSDARQRFRREAQIIASLQHPAIVSIFDYGTFTDGGVYLVMELVRGEDLRRVLQRERRMDPERALKVLNAVCDGMEAAHREGVLHRDLKPENILLPTQGYAAKVLDFGVAKVVRDDGGEDAVAADASILTATGMIIGTPAYMAPEQLRGFTPDARCDIFSLGVIAYEMLTGELPFGRGSLADIVLAHARGFTGFPNHSDVPEGLQHAVTTALQTDPDKRPSTVRSFAQLLFA